MSAPEQLTVPLDDAVIAGLRMRGSAALIAAATAVLAAAPAYAGDLYATREHVASNVILVAAAVLPVVEAFAYRLAAGIPFPRTAFVAILSNAASYFAGFVFLAIWVDPVYPWLHRLTRGADSHFHWGQAIVAGALILLLILAVKLPLVVWLAHRKSDRRLVETGVKVPLVVWRAQRRPDRRLVATVGVTNIVTFAAVSAAIELITNAYGS